MSQKHKIPDTLVVIPENLTHEASAKGGSFARLLNRSIKFFIRSNQFSDSDAEIWTEVIYLLSVVGLVGLKLLL